MDATERQAAHPLDRGTCRICTAGSEYIRDAGEEVRRPRCLDVLFVN